MRGKHYFCLEFAKYGLQNQLKQPNKTNFFV